MAQTRGSYVSIDDTRVDAESPITESLMFDIRDQWYDALCNSGTAAPDDNRLAFPERAKTDETDQTLFARPDGSGGVEFAAITSAVVSAIANSGTTFYGVSDTKSIITLDSTVGNAYLIVIFVQETIGSTVGAGSDPYVGIAVRSDDDNNAAWSINEIINPDSLAVSMSGNDVQLNLSVGGGQDLRARHIALKLQEA